MATSKSNDSALFLKNVIEVLGWKHMNKDLVMDIGCGRGRTSKAIVKAFPDVREIVAIDVDPTCLAEAAVEYSNRKVTYHKADIRKKSEISRWIGKVDKVVSVFCFNCFPELRVAYENMFCLLKPGGQAAFVQSLRSGYYSFVTEMKEHPRWNKYIGHVTLPTSQEEVHSVEYYKNMLQDIGFEVVQIFEEDQIYGHTFSSDEECQNTICGSCPLYTFIPEPERPEFYLMSFEVFQKHNKRNSQGRIILEHCTLSGFLKKPTAEPSKELNIPPRERLV